MREAVASTKISVDKRQGSRLWRPFRTWLWRRMLLEKPKRHHLRHHRQRRQWRGLLAKFFDCMLLAIRQHWKIFWPSAQTILRSWGIESLCQCHSCTSTRSCKRKRSRKWKRRWILAAIQCIKKCRRKILLYRLSVSWPVTLIDVNFLLGLLQWIYVTNLGYARNILAALWIARPLRNLSALLHMFSDVSIVATHLSVNFQMLKCLRNIYYLVKTGSPYLTLLHSNPNCLNRPAGLRLECLAIKNLETVWMLPMDVVKSSQIMSSAAKQGLKTWWRRWKKQHKRGHCWYTVLGCS